VTNVYVRNSRQNFWVFNKATYFYLLRHHQANSRTERHRREINIFLCISYVLHYMCWPVDDLYLTSYIKCVGKLMTLSYVLHYMCWPVDDLYLSLTLHVLFSWWLIFYVLHYLCWPVDDLYLMSYVTCVGQMVTYILHYVCWPYDDPKCRNMTLC
jgi:hypothetical protein